MRTLLLAVGVAASSMFLATAMGCADDAPESAVKRPFGIQERTPWTTSKIRGAPDPPAPYRIERVFEKLKFAEPLDLVSAPGTDRLFVAERYGKIYSFPNDPRVERAELFLDLGKVIYGMAFHPKFSENGYVYVTYLADPKNELPDGTHVSRFQVRARQPVALRSRAASNFCLTWPSGGHNGGCLQFGPDGYLYIATGDAGEIADPNEAGQDLSNLPGSILRIDVDRRDADKAYAIPADNPFVGVAGARAEIWAFGLRQPWKMSFDRETGDLWTGNVGQDLWEMIYRIERGGNYGWSITEGSHPFRPERKRGPGPIIPPIVEHDHANFRSITGGFVYRGRRLPELVGAYIYGDYDTGRIWMLRYDREAEQGDGKQGARRLEPPPGGIRRRPRRRAVSVGPHERPDQPAGAQSGQIDGRLPAHAERDGPVRIGRRPRAGPGPDSLFGHRSAMVRRRDEGALPGHAGRRANRVRNAHLPAARPGRPARLEVSRRHGARRNAFARNGEQAIPRAAAGWRREFCTTSAWPGAKTSAISTGRATPTCGTTSKPTPSCSKTPRGSTALTPSAIPTRPAAGGSRPGISPAAPNAPSATTWRPSTCWACKRCK